MILFYGSEDNPEKDNIRRQMIEHHIRQPVVPVNSLDALESRLRQPHQDIDIIFICIGDAIEMAQLTRMRSLLIDSRIVMVLPNRDRDMVTWAHKIGPRFIAYADNGDQQVGGVLDKMLGRNTHPENLYDLDYYRQKRV